MATGKIKWFVGSQGTSSKSATWILENNGTNVPITDGNCGFQQFVNLCASAGLDGEATGGPNTPGNNGTIAFLTSPVDVPPMEQGRISMGGVSLAVAHSGPYGIRFNSAMAFEFDWSGGQLVMNQNAGVTQTGVVVSPRNALPCDPNGPCFSTVRLRLPSLVGLAQTGAHSQTCLAFDQSVAPITQCEFDFMEINGGNYGLTVSGGQGHGFISNDMSVIGLHGQSHVGLYLGQDSFSPSLYGNNIRATINANVECYGFAYWGAGDIVDVNILFGDDGNKPKWGMSLGTGSNGLRCRSAINMGGVYAAPESGPNYVNGLAHSA